MSTGADAGSGEGREWLRWVPLVVDAHVCSGSVVEVSPHPDEARLVVSIAGSNSAAVHLFTPRAELVRLIEIATAGLAELDAQMALAEDIANGPGAAGTESAG